MSDSDILQAIEELKARLKSSEDGSFTTDSTSTGGSDSESEHGAKPPKPKKEKIRERSSEKPHTASRPIDVVKLKPPKNVEASKFLFTLLILLH